ncbi:MAG: ribosome maturation factor RimP [Bacteroidia bacterium]|nr:ribosome maturation factor RimP [Bacteroidia bacterium]
MKKDPQTIANDGDVLYIMMFQMWGVPAFFIMVPTEQQIFELLQPLVLENGAKLVDITVRGQRNRTVVEVFADTDQGIAADQLADISRAVDAFMEAEQWFDGAYTLNVSSPGLERPIRFPWQFGRHKNRHVALLRAIAGGQQPLEGEIHDVDEEQLILRVGNGFVAIPHDEIMEAHIIAKL